MTMIAMKHVSYSYKTKYQTVHAVRDVSWKFEKGRMYAITGESGSGKSTLLSLLAGLDLPDKGKISINGADLSVMDLDQYRKEQASVIYQSFHLFPLLTALENVMFPMELQGISRKNAEEQAKILIKNVGLDEKIYRQFPQMMSGGEQQRIAIARAFASGGEILLADEPTGNLDSENERHVTELLKRAAHERQMLVIVITHNQEVAGQADTILKMRDGTLLEVSPC